MVTLSLSIRVVLLHLSPLSTQLTLPPTSFYLYTTKPKQAVLYLCVSDSLQNNYTIGSNMTRMHTHAHIHTLQGSLHVIIRD